MSAKPQPERYRTIVADPPWAYPEGFHQLLPDGHRKTVLPYPALSLEEICELPVRQLADRDCRLFLWTTNKYLEDAFTVQRVWGFRHVQTLVWEKTNAQPTQGSLAPNVEFLLVCRKGAPPRSRRMPSAVLRIPKGAHSQKPEAWLDWIEQVSPGPYLELFARRQRIGWDTWGDQSLCHITLEPLP